MFSGSVLLQNSARQLGNTRAPHYVEGNAAAIGIILKESLPMKSWIALATVLLSLQLSTAEDVQALEFGPGCHRNDRVTIAAVGDFLFHRRLQVQAYTRTEGFRSLWKPVEHLLKDADITYGNLEGPVAPGVRGGGVTAPDPGLRFDNRVYTTYPLFNYHPRIVGDLKASGIDIVSTANNHSLDRGALGARKTIESLRAGQMPFTGSRFENQPRQFEEITETNGNRIAWLACTYSTNGIPDRKELVLQCYKDRKEVLQTISKLSKEDAIDAVILTPHWGAEYQPRPGGRQRSLAKDALAAGATAVIGAHPHVPQIWEVYEQEDGRQGLVIYSTGNFISNQRTIPQRTGLIAWLDLCPNAKTGKLSLTKAEYTPTWVIIDGKGLRVSNNDGATGKPISSASYNHVTRLLPDDSVRRLPEHLQSSGQNKISSALPWHYFHP